MNGKLRSVVSERRAGGQALVEFSLAFIVFVVLLMAVFDFGRGIYIYNGVSQAAREIARTTSVHPGNPLGQSPEALQAIAVQRGLVPGIEIQPMQCVDVDGTAFVPPHPTCREGDYVVVTVKSVYRPVAILAFLGTFTLESTSSVQVPTSGVAP